jgi:hypothetical protein
MNMTEIPTGAPACLESAADFDYRADLHPLFLRRFGACNNEMPFSILGHETVTAR